MENKAELQKLIALGKSKKVMDFLLTQALEGALKEDSDLSNSIIQLTSRFNKLRKDQNMGLLTSEQANMQNARIQKISPNLYPMGPTDQAIWERADGSISALQLSGSSGSSAWFNALSKLKQGGGGGSITLEKLLEAMKEDFAGSEELKEVRKCFGID